MSNRKLSVFELNILHAVILTAVNDVKCPENFLNILVKMDDCIKTLVGGFDQKANNTLWVLANNPVFATEPRLNGKNAIDGFLDGVLDHMVKDMAKLTVIVPAVESTQPPVVTGSTETVTTIVVTETTTPVTDAVLQGKQIERHRPFGAFISN